MLKRQLGKEDQIPILNKPPAINTAIDTEDENDQYPTTSNNEQKMQTSLNNGVFYPPDQYEEYIPFMAYEHFSISKKAIRELCGTGDGCDVHIIFHETMLTLPQIGVSCLSYKNLWEDQAELQGQKTTTEKLSFIKIIPYRYYLRDVPDVEWANVSPQPNHTLTISLDIADPTRLKLRFSYTNAKSSEWFWVHYPPLITDYSLVLGIEKKDIYRNSRQSVIDICTTYGWLLWNMNCIQDECEAKECKQKQQKKESTKSISIMKLQDSGPNENECIICLEKGVDIMFYPCSHLIVHRKCFLEKSQEHKECCKCKQPISKLMQLRFPDAYSRCIFCDEKCRKFNSYCYPCGCSLGCIQGFRKYIKNKDMGLYCLKCGQILENIQPFYRS